MVTERYALMVPDAASTASDVTVFAPFDRKPIEVEVTR